MATNIEIEAKALISQKDYDKVNKFFHTERFCKAKQTNYYIDTEDLSLKKLGIVLRIREKGDFYLNLKAPLAEGLLEKNAKINWKDYEDFRDKGIFPDSSIKNFLIMLGIKLQELKIITSLVTERIEIENFEDKGKFAIDKNKYNNLIDYELELEANSLKKASDGLQEICERVGIEYHENKLSKESRAISSLNK